MKERDESKPLSSNIEIDNAYWGGKKKGKRGKGSENKTPLLAVVEKNKRGRSKSLKLNVVSAFKKDELKQLVGKHLKAGTNVLSDGLNCFLGIKEECFKPSAVVVRDSRSP